MSEIETLFSRLVRESAKGGTTSPQTKTALIKLGVALNSYTMDLPIGDYSYVAHRWDTHPHDGVVGLWVDFDIANWGRNTVYLKCSQLADCELTPEVDVSKFVVFSPQQVTALATIAKQNHPMSLPHPAVEYFHREHEWDITGTGTVDGLWITFDQCSFNSQIHVYLPASDLGSIQGVEVEVDAVDFPGYDHWEGRIKTLMNDIGMPDSQSLATAFKQLVNEMMQAHAATLEKK